MKANYLKVALFSAISLLPTLGCAEDYVGGSVGYSFSQKLKNLTGNENTNYPDPAVPTDPTTYFPNSHLSDVDLKNSFYAGIRYGHWLESYPAWGVEIEGNFSRPDFKRQNVSISHPNIGALLNSFGINQGYVTENQLSANIKLFQLSADALYRFSGVEKYEPYIGAGPTINVMKVSGTGYSGIFVSPDAGTMALVGLTPGPGPNISDTTTKIGANVKAGMLYKADKDMSLGFEYKFNWTPFHVSHFRSQSGLSGDFYSHTISAVLVKNF